LILRHFLAVSIILLFLFHFISQ